MYNSTLYPLCEVFMPDAVVCQCGADALTKDPVGGGNLTLKAYTTCVTHVANLSKPTLFLGGGVYFYKYLTCNCLTFFQHLLEYNVILVSWMSLYDTIFNPISRSLFLL